VLVGIFEAAFQAINLIAQRVCRFGQGGLIGDAGFKVNIVTGGTSSNLPFEHGRSSAFLARHDVYFETRVADQPALTEAAHALRYQVYCLERRFENADEHSNRPGNRSVRQARHPGPSVSPPHRAGDRTVRIILPDHRVDGGLPIAQLLAGNNIDLTNFVSVADCGGSVAFRHLQGIPPALDR